MAVVIAAICLAVCLLMVLIRTGVRYAKRGTPIQLLLIVTHAEDTIEGLLRTAYFQAARMSENPQILVLDIQGSEETKVITDLFSQDHPGIKYQRLQSDEIEALDTFIRRESQRLGVTNIVCDLRGMTVGREACHQILRKLQAK